MLQRVQSVAKLGRPNFLTHQGVRQVDGERQLTPKAASGP
jgi:hypothetical protein